MTIEQLVDKILENMGTKSNVITATNCMTRLRINVKSDGPVNEEALKALEGVMGLVHDRANYWEVVVGPGKCRKCADRCKDLGIPAAADATVGGDWKENKAAIKAGKPVFCEKPLANTAADCKAETNSAARLSADKFAVKNYNVDASSGSSARIRCTETLNASASSGASVRYAGDCRARIKTSSGGSIREN